MKQNIWALLFALHLLFFMPAKQTFSLDYNRLYSQDRELDTAVAMAERINAYRREAGLSPFPGNPILDEAAQKIADHMAATEFISHYDGDGANPTQRAQALGYTDHVTEIIYGGFGGNDAAWEWWLADELYHSLMLSEDYHEFGVGMAWSVESDRAYWAIVFGRGLPTDHGEEAANNASTAVPGAVTKRPVATNTAVSPPTPTNEQNDTAVAQQADNNNTADNNNANLNNNEAAANDSANPAATSLPTSPNPAPTSPPDAAPSNNAENTWLPAAAALTILVGILIFYFPRRRRQNPSP